MSHRFYFEQNLWDLFQKRQGTLLILGQPRLGEVQKPPKFGWHLLHAVCTTSVFYSFFQGSPIQPETKTMHCLCTHTMMLQLWALCQQKKPSKSVFQFQWLKWRVSCPWPLILFRLPAGRWIRKDGMSLSYRLWVVFGCLLVVFWLSLPHTDCGLCIDGVVAARLRSSSPPCLGAGIGPT